MIRTMTFARRAGQRIVDIVQWDIDCRFCSQFQFRAAADYAVSGGIF